jgi:hypothetical protein
MRIDRKQFLAQLVAAPVWAAALKADDGDDESAPGGRPGAESVEERVERILREYDAQGIHRTGTDVDETCARWLAQEAQHLGAQSQLESMPFSRIDVVECFVEVGGQRIEGVPLFDAPFSAPEGVRGTLTPAGKGAAGEVGFWLDTVPDAAGGKKFIEHRRTTAQSALVAVTGGEKYRLAPGLALLNAESYQQPFGVPVVQVTSEARSLVEGAAGSSVRVVSHAARKDVKAHNTLATVAGRDPSLAPLGVMTPRSGWWQCASERGGGIAVWLEILAAIAAAKPARTVNFVASTGHELGHYGLSHYLAERPELIAGTRAWIHLGANFTASIRPQVRMQFSDAELRSLALEALARHDLAPDVETPLGQAPIGEARNVADGGRYISITGFNGHFHQASDRFPEAVDLRKAIAFAKAYSEIALALAAA